MCFGSAPVVPTRGQLLTTVSRSSCCRGTVQDPNSQRGQTDSFTAGMNPSFWSRTQAAKLDPHRPRGFSGSVLGDQVDNQNRQWT